MKYRLSTVLLALAALLLAGAYGLSLASTRLDRQLVPLNGLVRSFFPTPGFQDPPQFRGRSGTVDLQFLGDDPGLPRRMFSVRWEGFWNVEHGGPINLYTRADDRLDVLVDGQRVAVHGLADGQRTAAHTLHLTPGIHRVRVDYVQQGGVARLVLEWSLAGGPRRMFGSEGFFPEEPSSEVLRIARRAGRLRSLADGTWSAFTVIMALALSVLAIRLWVHARASIIRWASGPPGEAAAVLAVTGSGAVLRLEALVKSYGTVPLGPALEAVQTQLAAVGPWLHGGRFLWRELAERSGDPLAYLNNARAMTWFYEGLPREPVFIYATKWWLWLTNDADVAVSAASATFSVLCVPATYLVGRLAFGRVAGLIAASVVAIEPQLIRWGVQGWRDDAFTFFFLVLAASCLMFRAKPSAGHAVLLALSASLALLTRLTALSFIAPALVLLALEGAGAPRRDILRRLVIATVAMAALVAPYLIDSWMKAGDPFNAINRNTVFYRERAGQDASENLRADSYVISLVRARPVTTADTALQGVTTYPFRNKFRGLAPWSRLLPASLAVLSMLGLLAWLWSPQGRLLLALLAFSLVPYAFTWQIPGGAEWRFTMHVYPLFLIAAASSTAAAFRIARGALADGPQFRRHLPGQVGRAAISVAGAGVLAGMLFWMPYPRFRETLDAEGSASISAGWRDVVFFRRDWSGPVERDGVTTRTSRGDAARVWLPLVPNRAYHVNVALAAAETVLGSSIDLRTYLNGRPVASASFPTGTLTEYAFDVESEAVHAHNVIEFRAAVPTPEMTFALRSLRVSVRGGRETPGQGPD